MTLSSAVLRLDKAGVDAPEHDAREIFIHVLGLNRYLPIDKTRDYDSEKLEEYVSRREGREPLAYILGETAFYKEVYEVTPDVLVPRPDTEILVEYAVKNLPKNAVFLDLCTGSGCVAISTLASRGDTRAVAVDISPEAIEVAKRNAEKNGVGNRLTVVEADIMKDPLPIIRADAILSNPPYIPDAVCDTLSPEVKMEPRIALAGGRDGMDFYKRIIPLGSDVLSSGGFIAFEIGYDEGDKIKELAKSLGLSTEIIKDYSSLDRVAVIRKP
jgi:release factor glutamine methyltransferase